jgi:NagD protein
MEAEMGQVVVSKDNGDPVGASMAVSDLGLRGSGYVPSVTSDLSPILDKEAFLFDFDGTVWMGNTMIAGVVETIQQLRVAGKQPIFLTNNSSKSTGDYLGRLRDLGLCDDPNEIVMSTDTVTTYLKAHGYDSAFIMGTESMKAMCAENGVRHEEDPTKVRVVVIGFDKTATADKLTFVARLVSKGVPYVVAHPDPFCPSDEGPIMDCGSYYAAIKTCTKVDAQAVLGKPSACMVEEVEKRFPIARDKMVIFGDRLYTDIALGREANVSTVLVLTGENTLADAASSPERPTWILNSVADLLGKLS